MNTLSHTSHLCLYWALLGSSSKICWYVFASLSPANDGDFDVNDVLLLINTDGAAGGAAGGADGGAAAGGAAGGDADGADGGADAVGAACDASAGADFDVDGTSLHPDATDDDAGGVASSHLSVNSDSDIAAGDAVCSLIDIISLIGSEVEYCLSEFDLEINDHN